MNRFEYYSKVQEYQENHIEHHGIIGQKWGQRRWQNPNGTYTEEGKKRYFGSGSDNKKETDDKTKSIKLKNVGLGMIMESGDNDKDAKYFNFIESKLSKYNSKKDVERAKKYRKEIVDAFEAYDNGDINNFKKIMNGIEDKKDRDAVTKMISSMVVEMKNTKPQEGREFKFEGQPSKKTESAMNEILDQAKLGSISKPKINPKYLNEDGSLNDLGRKKVESKSRAADVGSSVFKVLKYINLASLAIAGPATFALTLSGFGLPAALISTLTLSLPTAGTALAEGAISNKLSERADAYYDKLIEYEKKNK